MEKFSSILGQILQIFSRRQFFEAVFDTKAAKGSRGSASGIALWPCRFAGIFGKGGLLGIRKAPKRSTSAYANEHRPWRLHELIAILLFTFLRFVLPSPGLSRTWWPCSGFISSVTGISGRGWTDPMNRRRCTFTAPRYGSSNNCGQQKWLY